MAAAGVGTAVALTAPVMAPTLWSVGGPVSRMLVPLFEDTNESEYAMVVGRWVDGGVRKSRIHRIYRIQNGALYAGYISYRTAMAAAARRRAEEAAAQAMNVKADPDAEAVAAAPQSVTDDDEEITNEDLLWHGAEESTIYTILARGFDMRVSNQSGLIGVGNYFAWSSKYSLRYSSMGSHAHAQHRVRTERPAGIDAPENAMFMVLARVVLGRVGPSSAGFRVPCHGFDSAAANDICCVFDNNACYPEYLVVFT